MTQLLHLTVSRVLRAATRLRGGILSGFGRASAEGFGELEPCDQHNHSGDTQTHLVLVLVSSHNTNLGSLTPCEFQRRHRHCLISFGMPCHTSLSSVTIAKSELDSLVSASIQQHFHDLYIARLHSEVQRPSELLV